jgi:hypothetical protein
MWALNFSERGRGFESLNAPMQLMLYYEHQNALIFLVLDTRGWKLPAKCLVTQSVKIKYPPLAAGIVLSSVSGGGLFFTNEICHQSFSICCTPVYVTSATRAFLTEAVFH